MTAIDIIAAFAAMSASIGAVFAAMVALATYATRHHFDS